MTTTIENPWPTALLVKVLTQQQTIIDWTRKFDQVREGAPVDKAGQRIDDGIQLLHATSVAVEVSDIFEDLMSEAIGYVLIGCYGYTLERGNTTKAAVVLKFKKADELEPGESAIDWEDGLDPEIAALLDDIECGPDEDEDSPRRVTFSGLFGWFNGDDRAATLNLDGGMLTQQPLVWLRAMPDGYQLMSEHAMDKDDGGRNVIKPLPEPQLTPVTVARKLRRFMEQAQRADQRRRTQPHQRHANR